MPSLKTCTFCEKASLEECQRNADTFNKEFGKWGCRMRWFVKACDLCHEGWIVASKRYPGWKRRS